MPKPWHQRQKEQGVKLVLSWFAPRNAGRSTTTARSSISSTRTRQRATRRRCLSTMLGCIERKHTRPLGAEYEHHIQLFRQCLDWYGRFGTPEDEEDLYAEIAKLVTKLEAHLAAEEPLPPIFSLPAGRCH